MYGKIFDSMYDGTISANWKGLVTFQQMIVLCDADGTIDMTPPAIARRTGIPLDIISDGIAFLEEPDPYSRSPDFDGRRIVRIDDHRSWGWFIVNHNKYKQLQDADAVRAQTRERVKKHRENKKRSESQIVTDSNGQKRHTDTDTDTLINSAFATFWDMYPRKKDKKKALIAFKKNKCHEKMDLIMPALRLQLDFKDWEVEKFIPYPTTYINGARWEDEIEVKEDNSGYGDGVI